jgi:UDP-N-acetylmuramyl pentapeptide phosphotransferase/UDP-N-acetylglucosamine-1-phosphate transferase
MAAESELHDDNAMLVRKIAAVEQELEKRKVDMKTMQKKHMEELRNREWREMMVVCTFSICVLVYACVALIMRE